MRKIWSCILLLLIIFLSSCSNSNETYQIPIYDFSTSSYDELQVEGTNSYFTLNVSEEIVDEFGLFNILISLSEDYNVQNNTTVYYNFEVNDFQLCANDLEIQFSSTSTMTPRMESCRLTIFDEGILIDDFYIDKIDIYITLRYDNNEGEGIFEKHLYAVIYGDLTLYRTN
jgi:hypothetical protein